MSVENCESLRDSLKSWISQSNGIESPEQRKELDILISKVAEVPFEYGYGKDLRDELSRIQNVVVKLGKEENEELIGRIEKVKESIFPAKVSDRLFFCYKIVFNGHCAAKALVENFEKFDLDESLEIDRLALCNKLIDHGLIAALALINNFEKFGLEKLPVSDRTALFSKIEKYGMFGTKALKENFEKLGFLTCLQDCKSLEERLAICKEIGKLGTWAELALVEKFDELGFVKALHECQCAEDRLAMCFKIAALGEWASAALIVNFKKLGLEEVSALDRLALCDMIAEKGSWSAIALVGNFHIIGLEKVNESDRLALCNKIAIQGNCAAKAVAENFEKLGLENTSESDRLSLCNKIAMQGKLAALVLVKNFEKFGLEKTDVSDRLALCSKIAEYNQFAVETLCDHFKKIGLEKASISDLLAFWNKIAMQGEQKAEVLAENFEKLGLEKASERDRLSLCNKIAMQGNCAAKALAENFEKLGLENTSESDRLSLCNKIAMQGKLAAQALAANFEKLGLEKLTISDRLTLASKIAQQDEDAMLTNFEKLGFITDIQNCNASVELIDLCNKVIALGGWATVGLTRNFKKLGIEKLPLSDLFALFNKMAEQGEIAASALISNALFCNFVHVWSDDVSVSDRLAFFKKIASQGGMAAETVAKNFEKLGLEDMSLSNRLALGSEIAKQGDSATKILCKNFEKIGFLKEIHKCSCLEKRLALCYEIASQGEWAAQALIKNFEKLVLEDLSLSDRQAFCTKMAKQGERAAVALIENFEKLGLEKASESDCLALLSEIAMQGMFAASILAENFEKLELRELSISIRLALLSKIAGQGDLAARILVKYFEKLGLEEVSISERLALCREIAKRGESAAMALAMNFEKFGLEEVSDTDRLFLCREIAKRGESAAKALAENFEKLGFEEVSISERLTLCSEIAKSGESAAKVLAENFEKLGLEKVSDTDCINLVKSIAEQGRSAAELLSFKMITHGFVELIKRQILFEVTTLPDDISDEFKSLAKRDYASKVKPLLSLLLVEDVDIESDEFKKCIAKSPVKLVFEDIQKQKDPPEQLTKWAAYTAGVFFDFEKDKIEAIEKSNILDCIYGHQIPSNRFAFTRELRSLDLEDLKMPKLKLKKSKRADKTQSRSNLSWILLSRMKQLGFLKREKILERINDIREFNDTKKFDALVQLFLLVIKESPYASEETKLIEEVIFSALTVKKGEVARKEEITVIVRKLQIISNFWTIFGKDQLIACLKSGKNLERVFQERFQSLFELDNLNNFGDRYQKTFGSFRDKTALFSYLRSIESLQQDEKAMVKKAFSFFVKNVLTGDFPKIRYNFEDNAHLEVLFGGREDFKKLWLKAGDPRMIKVEIGKAQEEDYAEFFKQKILNDRHLNPDDFPFLKRYLYGEDISLKGQDNPEVKFQSLAIALFKGEMKIEAFLSEVKELNLELGEFENDLKSLMPQKSLGEYEISESDDPCDLLLIGTEIQGSCQRVNGNSRINKCLTSYLINGEIRPIVVKRDGRLVARSLLRLMWDDKNQTPVLLLERQYSNVQNEAIKKAILDWASNKAKTMEIPLVSKEVGSGENYDGTVKFLGGGAPFVYSDASGGVLSGPFEAYGCHQVIEASKAI